MDEPVVEPVIDENLQEPVENTENFEKPLVKKNGRPKGSKDVQKRVVKPRKITIIEEPIHVEAPQAPVVMKTPKPKAVTITPEPEIQYVDRYLEHSPRSLIRHAHTHLMNEQNAKHAARRDHFSNMILRSLR